MGIALAYWIMGDGTGKANRITLCTEGFSIQDVVLLLNIIILKYDIQPTLQKARGSYNIYIGSKSFKKIEPKIRPHIVSSFLYKISYGVKHLT